MKIGIEFFQEDLLAAIGAGVYEIDVCKNGKTAPLYIGESVFVIVRCASHLYHLKKEPALFGFDEKTIDDPSITLQFRFLEEESDLQARKRLEKVYINNEEAPLPLSQSGISDRQKTPEEKIAALNAFLESA